MKLTGAGTLNRKILLINYQKYIKLIIPLARMRGEQ
jgi:hypothetical protein